MRAVLDEWVRTMKFREVVALVAVLVAGIVGVFAIYTWGWHDRTTSGGESGRLARAYADVVQRDFPAWHIRDVSHIDRGVWRVRSQRRGETRCFLPDVDRFKRLGKDDYEGVTPVAC
jgi:hypothetical protein